MSASIEPDERIKRYLQWYFWGLEGRTADWIIRGLDRNRLGEFESSQALYTRLANDGFPVCKVCGQTPARPSHCENPKRKRQPDLGTGRRVRLPDTNASSELFRAALKELALYIPLAESEESWLEGNTEEGRFKGKHFITHSVDRDALEIARREEFTEEEWRELCEQYGGDPAYGQVVLSRGEASPGGVTRTPSMFLVALVAAYALTNQPLAPLVRALHHAPDSVGWDQLVDNVDELSKVAGHLATRLRGGTVERGRGVEEISPEEHFLAWCIRTLDKEGLPSDEDVLARLRKTFPSIARELTTRDIDRIRREHLEPPE